MYRYLKSVKFVEPKESNTLNTTIDQWREELEKISLTKNDPGFTTKELANKLGLGQTATRQKIHKLIKAGKCKSGYATRIDSMGRPQQVPVYQLTRKLEGICPGQGQSC